MKSKSLIALMLAVALAACANAVQEAGMAEAVRQAEAGIGAAEVRARIAFLASEELEGRGTPSRGLEVAAAYIAEEFERFGLEPGADGGWLQRWPYPLEAIDPRQTRLEISSGSTHVLEYGLEFFAHPGTAPAASVGVVYVADIQELERLPRDGLRDRAALVRLAGLPEPARDGLRLDARARDAMDRAVALATDAGATAVLFVLDERVTRAEVGALAQTVQTPRRVLGGRAAAPDPAIFLVAHQPALRMFRMAGLDGAEQLRRPQLDRPVPLPGITLRLAAPFTTLDDAHPPNVVGILPGRDPVLRDSYLVLSAHMDGLGIGRPDATGDSIYNGADDNASGTAALLTIARAMASMPEPPARSILFLAVSGEERGLLGSRWFADNPTVPLESIVANINLDMIGRNAPDSIVAVGKEYSSLGPLAREVAEANPGLGLTISRDPWPEERFFIRSDHFSFAAREIPALFLFAGTHEDYHRPSDRVERIDADKAARVTRLAFLLALEVAERQEPPAWVPEGLETVRRMTR
jgi:hypothetical protein